MPLTIYILCGDATYNRGDRGNLSAQTDLLRERFPGARIIVDSFRPGVDQEWYRTEVIRRGLLLSAEQIRFLRAADVVVWGGGALVTDNGSRIKIPYWAVIIGFIKWVLRKPIMAWAHGLVINTQLGARFGRLALNWADLITVRDENSFQTLERIGATRPPHYLTADPAVLVRASSAGIGRRILAAEDVPTDGRPLFVIANTFCPFHYNSRDVLPYMIAWPLGLRSRRGEHRLQPLKNALARITDLLIDYYDCHVLFIPTYPAPWEEDLKHFQDVAYMAAHSEHISCLRGDTYSPHDYLALWHHFDLVVTIPLHHAIFSTVMEVPCVNLYYEPKGRDFFTAIDAKDRLLDVDLLFRQDGPELLLRTVDYTLSNWDSLLTRTRPLFKAVQARARQNADHLARLVQEHGP